MFKKFILAAGLVLAGFASSANASDYCYTWQKVTTYECVTNYVCKQVPYTQNVCQYDSCGRAYYVQKTYYKTVEVPVVKQVPVVKWVKQYHG